MAIVMGVLIVSFGVWGIADIFRGFGQSSLAKIGSTEISIDSFRQTYNDRLQQISQQVGRPITPVQARAVGIDRQVLQQVLAEATLDDNSQRLGLNLSDAEIGKSIAADPNFKGPTGSFDQDRFTQIIRQGGYTPQRYIATQRNVTLRREIAGTIVAGLTPSKTQLDAFNQFQNEQRGIAYVRLTPAQAGTIDPPSDQVLQSYYDDHKALFRAPEYRKITIVSATTDDIAKWTDVSDDDARKAFEAAKARFSVPEKRQVQQIVFPNVEDAAAGREKLVGGESFEDLAKERGLNPSDVDLGTVVKTGIIDPAIANAAFALPLDEISQPVAGKFGTALIKVSKIEPGSTPTYESMATQVKHDLALDRARTQAQDIYNKMEDERGGGASVSEAAKKVNLPERTIEVDRSGRAPDGSQVTGLPAGVDIITPAFNSDIGIDNDAISAPNGGYVWFDVTDITKTHDRPFDDVKDQVLARWRTEEISTRLKAKADDIAAKLGTDAKGDLGQVSGLTVETATGLKRGEPATGVAAGVHDAAFTTEKNAVAVAPGDPGEWVVFRVTDVTTPQLSMDAPDIKKLSTDLQQVLADEQTGEYILKLQSNLGVTINEQGFMQATGAAPSDTDQQQ
jgi:peptidyl-prolyl cis-trans isomerase D